MIVDQSRRVPVPAVPVLGITEFRPRAGPVADNHRQAHIRRGVRTQVLHLRVDVMVRMAISDEVVVDPSCWRRGLQARSEEHTSELQSHLNLVCRLLLEKKKQKYENTQCKS